MPRAPVPFVDDRRIDFGSVSIHLPEHLAGQVSTDDCFVMGKSRDMIDRLLEEVGDAPVRRIVDVGVYQGGSVVLLNEVFAPEKLVAIELNPNDIPPLSRYIARCPPGRVRWYRGVNQADHGALGRICADEFGGEPLDLVVDDASHLYVETRETFRALFPRLREGGLYVIEDWGWAHWPGDHWQKERGGDFFRQRAPMSNLLIDLMLMCAGAPGTIRGIKVTFGVVYVERGGAPLAPGFDLAACCLNRGEPIPRFGEWRPPGYAIESPTFRIR